MYVEASKEGGNGGRRGRHTRGKGGTRGRQAAEAQRQARGKGDLEASERQGGWVTHQNQNDDRYPAREGGRVRAWLYVAMASGYR